MKTQNLKFKFQNFKQEFSAGLVVFKKAISNQLLAFSYQFLIGKHSGYHKWVLPKGLIEKGEKGWQTAMRETEEEMGVKARPLHKKPIHIEKYIYFADLKNRQEPKTKNQEQRRVKKYQESFDPVQDKSKKTKVFKTVSFYLAEYVSGDPKDHDWEMEEAGWYDYDKALKLLAFKGEKEALEKAFQTLQELEKQPKLL